MPEENYEHLFDDETFRARYPGLKMPPPSFVSSGAKVVHYEAGVSLSLEFPVREEQTNPVGTLQGGILCSFFDDAFGTLAFVSVRKPCLTIDMSVNFIRPVKPGQTVLVRAVIRSRTRKLAQLSAEAFTGNEKLIATAFSNLIISDAGGDKA